MKKISEYRDDDALDLLADLIEPAMEIFGDASVREAFQDNRLRGVSVAIKKHKKAVRQILARMDGVPVEEFHCNVYTLPGRAMEILNDNELLAFFTEQAQTMTSDASSGPAMEVIEGTGRAAE